MPALETPYVPVTENAAGSVSELRRKVPSGEAVSPSTDAGRSVGKDVGRARRPAAWPGGTVPVPGEPAEAPVTTRIRLQTVLPEKNK